MRKGLLWLLGMWCCSAGQLLAQSAPAANSAEAKATPEVKKQADASSVPAGGTSVAGMDNVPVRRAWAQVDYLLWWMKDAPLPVPIVTTGDPHVGFDPNFLHTVNTAGAVGQPGTQVLFGGNNIHEPTFSGIRLTLGGWVDDEEIFGVDGNGFILDRGTTRFAAVSDKSGNPAFYFPIFSASAGAERGIPIADPLRAFSGDAGAISTLQLWGAEVNGLVNLYRNSCLEFTVLAGFRYADLREELQIYNTTTDLAFGNVTNLNDFFRTTNQFYGGQLGSRLALQLHPWSLDLTSKIALGATHELVDIQGNITQAGPNPLVPPGLGTFPGGLFAQPSNLGKRDADSFTVLSSLELKVGYAFTARARLFAGYDILYWNEVVRPGNQIDHRVNLTQNAVLDPNGVGKRVGPAQPVALFERSDFWAQGLNVGLEVRY